MPRISGQRCLIKQNKSVTSEINSQDHLSFLYFNAKSIVNKIELLHNYINNLSFDVFLISETWLNECTPTSMLCSPGYNIIRQDSNLGRWMVFWYYTEIF